MATKPLFTLLLFLVVFSLILSTTTANFIKSSCHATRYPSLCYHSLSGYAPQIGKSHRQLTLTALAVSLSRARSAARFASRMKTSKGIKNREVNNAVNDCVNNMNNGVDQLNRSFQELANLRQTNGEDFSWHMSNVQTWVSAALTDVSTCADGLSGGHYIRGVGKVKGAIQTRVNHVAQLTSNALALVNHFVSKY